MKSNIYSILTILIFTLVPAAALANDRDLPEELKVLNRFIGTWDNEITNRHPGQEAKQQKAESRRTWSLGGSFLQIEDVNWAVPHRDEFQMLLTYGVLEKQYVGVIIDGTTVFKVTAEWDEAASSMKFDAKNDEKGIHLQYTLQFLDENTAKASGSLSKNGKLMSELNWKQTRRAE